MNQLANSIWLHSHNLYVFTLYLVNRFRNYAYIACQQVFVECTTVICSFHHVSSNLDLITATGQEQVRHLCVFIFVIAIGLLRSHSYTSYTCTTILSFCYNCDFCGCFLDTDDKTDPLWMKALEGFVMLLSKDVDIIYVSESVAKYLGISQVKTIINIY